MKISPPKNQNPMRLPSIYPQRFLLRCCLFAPMLFLEFQTTLAAVPPKTAPVISSPLPGPENDFSIDSLAMKFVDIQPGTFIMGNPNADTQPDAPIDETQHQVTLTIG